MTDTLQRNGEAGNGIRRRCTRGYGMGPCNKRSCPICAVRRRKDWRWVFQQNLGSLGDVNVLMVSVTAPGSDVLPFDKSLCSYDGEHTCSGRVGCVADLEAVMKWRETLEARWSKLTDAARIRTKRACTVVGPLMLAGAWELQKRRVPHVHVVVPDSAAGRFFIDSLGLFAPNYGFGFVDTKVRPRHVLVAANYLAKYMTKYDQDEDLASELLPSREFFVSREVSMQTGATVRICRLVRKWWAYQNGLIDYPQIAFKFTSREFEFVKKFYKGDVFVSLDDEIRAGNGTIVL